MGNLSHTVGGTDNLVSFKSAARVPIDSLKVHFSPIQEGEGDPSPENIRPIRGWNEVEAYRVPEIMPFKVIYKTIESLGVSFTCDNSGVITANGIPTSWSTFKPIEVEVKGNEILYETIFGNMQNVTITAPSLFDKNDNLIESNLFDAILGKDYGLDLSQYPGVTKVRVGIKRNTNNVPMTGSCIIAITNGAIASASTIPVTFPVTGKNKFNGEISNTDIDNSGQILDSINNNRISTSLISIAHGQYTLSSSENYPVAIYAYDDNGFITNESLVTWQESPTTFVIENAKYVRFKWKKPDDSAFSPLDITNIQLELGLEATAYESYNPDNTIYGGYVDLAKGEVVAEWAKVTKKLSDYTKLTDYGDIINYDYSPFSNIPCFAYGNGSTINKNNSMCSIAPHRWALQDSKTTHYYVYRQIESNTTYLKLYLLPSDVPSEDTEFEIAFKLKDPIHYPLTSTQLKTFLNNNAFWSNTNDVTEVSYAIHDTAPIRAAKKRIMAASPKLETASSDLVTFNTDVTAPLKECKIEFKPKQDLHGYDRPWVGGAGKNLLKISADNRIGIMDTATETDTGFDIADANINGGYLVKVKPNTTYTYSYTSTYNGGSMYGRIWKFAEKPDSSTGLSTGSLLINKTSWTGSATFTTDENTNWVVAGAYAYDKGLNSSLTNMQVEEGSVVTSYEPYENICPIEGWNSLEMYKTSKSIAPFLANPFSFSYQDYYNGSSGWSNIINSDELPTGAQLTYSAYLNCTNAVVSGENCVKIWIMQSNGKYRYAEGNIIQTGNSGMSYISTNVRDTDVSFEFGLGIRKGTIASNPMVEINNAPSNFEPYNGTTIPITFPAEAGTIYGGYVDFVSGELVKTHLYYERLISEMNNSESYPGWTNTGLGEYTGGQGRDIIYTLNNNIAKYAGLNCKVDNGILYFSKPNVGNLTQTEFKEKYGDMIAQFVFPLATPIHYSIDPQTLKTLRGTNNIWSTSNGPITIKYWKH